MNVVLQEAPTLTPAKAPAREDAPLGLMNAMTIDLEEWFHVTNFEGVIERSEWPSLETRVQESMPRLLDVLAEFDVKATFFSLGWVAREFPWIIRRLTELGHEVASHGDEHKLLVNQTPKQFREQLVRSKDILEQLSQQPVVGHRAPSYSLRYRTRWAVDIMIEEGFLYDSSVFPFGPRKESRLCASRVPCVLDVPGVGQLTEYPLSIEKVYGMDLPIAGGGYFRFLPLGLINQGIRQINARGHRYIMYLHPWELDPDQPRVRQASWLAKFRHYHQLHKTEDKLRNLLSEFRFGSIKEIFWSEEMQGYSTDAQN